MHRVYLSLGSNIGNREYILKSAIDMIDNKVGHVVKESSFIETKPWGFSSPNMFLNACVCCETEQTPREVLRNTQSIEALLGRTKKSIGGKYSDRIVDIDILLYDNLHFNEPDLKIPHPLMLERDFVMVPLHQII